MEENRIENSYESLKKQHEENKRQVNRLLPFVAVFAFLYMISGQNWLMIAGAAYLIAVFLLFFQKNRALCVQYQAIERELLKELLGELEIRGITPADGQIGIGYRSAAENFNPVFLCRSNGNLYLFENLLTRNLIYSVGGLSYILFSLNVSALDTYSIYTDNAFRWELFEERHLQLLRGEALRLQRFSVMESFLYDDILTDMLRHGPKKPINASAQLAMSKKEKVYSALPENGIKLFLAENTAKRMRIIPEQRIGGGSHEN